MEKSHTPIVSSPTINHPDTMPPTSDKIFWPNQVLQGRSRGWELGLPDYVDPQNKKPPVMIAVGGGKGGVGKSMVAANLSCRLAQNGKKVLAIDLDVGGANLHTYFGMSSPKFNLADAFVYERKSLFEAAVPTPVNGVQLLAGGREEAWGGLSSIDKGTLQKLMKSVLDVKESDGIDFIVFDLGAGTNQITLDIFAIANLGLITVLPEPTSIENAYLFLKTSLFNVLDNVGTRTDSVELAKQVKQFLIHGNGNGASKASGYADRLKQVSKSHPVFAQNFKDALQGRVVGFAINQIRSQKDIDIGKSMEVIGQNYFGFNSKFCGFLNYDDAAWKSLRNRRMLSVDFPHAVLSRRFNDLVKNVSINLGF